MAWVKMESRYARHPKIMAAGPDAMALDVGGMGYSRDYNTGGFVPDAALPTISCAKNPKAAAKRLMVVGRWERDDNLGGYWVHDFDEYNPADEQKQRSEKASKAARARWSKGQETSPEHDPTDAMVDAWSTANPDAPSIDQALLNGCEPDAIRAGAPAYPGAAARPRPHPTPPLVITNTSTTNAGCSPADGGGRDLLIAQTLTFLASQELHATLKAGVHVANRPAWLAKVEARIRGERSDELHQAAARFADDVRLTPAMLLGEIERAERVASLLPGARSFGETRATSGVERDECERHVVAAYPTSPELQSAAMDAYDAVVSPPKTRLEIIK